MRDAPKIASSTEDERRLYVKTKFPCIADCDACGFCRMYHSQDPEAAYRDYIAGEREFIDVTMDYRRY